VYATDLHQHFDHHLQVALKPGIFLRAPTRVAQCPTKLDGELANGDNIAQATKCKGGLHSDRR
jgi:hypothetical protein